MTTPLGLGLLRRRMFVGLTTVAVLLSVGVTPSHAASASARPVPVQSERSDPAGYRPPGSATHGAGVNQPRYDDASVSWEYTCLPDGSSRFRVQRASIVMWSKGARIKGFHFKYRLVPTGTDGQIQLPYNWSKNARVSFPQGSRQSSWVTAGRLGQSFGSDLGWDIEVKLKYPRSLRIAYRYKYRLSMAATPACGGLVSDKPQTVVASARLEHLELAQQ